MKTSREISQQDSGKAPVTFQDVAACFSDDEWELLLQWQKDLYENVMKEIHQSLISLGPVIASSVFSLRAKEKEHLWTVDHLDSERRRSNNHSPGATISNFNVFRISREDNKCQEDPRNVHRREKDDPLHTGFQALNSDIIPTMELKMEGSLMADPTAGGEVSTGTSSGYTIPMTSFRINEGETHAMAHQDSERRENVNSPTVVLPSFNTMSEASVLDHTGAAEGECSSSVRSGKQVVTPIVSFSIKEEVAYSMDHQDAQRKKSRNIWTGVNNTVNSTEQQRANSWQTASMSSECGRSISHKIDVVHCRNIKPEEAVDACTEYGSSFCQRSTYDKHKRTHTGQGPYSSMEYTKSFRESATPSPQQEVHTGLKLYITGQCGNGFHQSANETSHCQINKGEQQNVASECEKSVQQSTNHIKEQRKMGEKPHTCGECGKSFRKSATLVTHQRLHTGEKPYSCSQCGKDFRQLPHLVVHQRLHTGEKPYICNICERPFINSSNLKRHQQIHTR